MHGSTQPDSRSDPRPDDRFAPASAGETSADDTSAGTEPPASAGGRGDNSNGNRTLEETELDSALQLLVERAQYITGATGTALALPQGEEMVCRASAGSSAPAVGARLQVRSGLTGESMARRQLLRCDNAETDARVNLDACRALGIASIVVLPLLRRNGEVRGLFELFSDHPYAFEERDLIALERMADLTLTALDLAEHRQSSAVAPAPRRERERPVESLPAVDTPQATATGLDVQPAIAPEPELVAPVVLPADPQIIVASPPVTPLLTPSEPVPPASIPEAMLRVQKCSSCGFPVSEGRTLCLDCERKDSQKKESEKKQREQEQHQIEIEQLASPDAAASSATPTPAPEEFVPAFLANSEPVRESWMANHVNLLAIVVLILGILVAVVVFR
jgi:putative methionine-R-sulfoxide reductase with GAF domain